MLIHFVYRRGDLTNQVATAKMACHFVHFIAKFGTPGLIYVLDYGLISGTVKLLCT